MHEYIFLYNVYLDGSTGTFDLYWAETPMVAVKKFFADRKLDDRIIFKGLTAFQDGPIEDMIAYVNQFLNRDEKIYRILEVSSVEEWE